MSSNRFAHFGPRLLAQAVASSTASVTPEILGGGGTYEQPSPSRRPSLAPPAPRRRGAASANPSARGGGVLCTAPHIVLIASLLAALLAFALPAAASAAPPVVSIEDATNVAYTAAEVEGEIDPESIYTTWHFEYVSDDQFQNEGEWTFATQAGFGESESPDPVEAGTTLGGLQPSTTYHLRLVAENSEAQRVEALASTFTTEGPIDPPAVSGVSSEAVSYLTATATGVLELANDDPGFNTTACRFEYLTQAAWQANGNAFPEPEGAPSAPCDTQPAGEGSHPVSAALAALQPGTTYHLRLVAANQGGTGSAEAPSTFTTLAVAKPTIEHLTASEITGSTAHLSAEVDPGGSGDPVFDTAWHFECVPSCAGNLSGTVPAGPSQEVEATAKGLLPNRTYTLYLYATNAGGTRKATLPEEFKTPGAAPQINPFDAGPLTPTSAGINAEVNPNGTATVYWFEWGAEDCSTGACASLPASHEANAGNSPYFTDISRTLTGLQPQTTYHFRLVARNSFGIAEGPDREFSTPAAEPPCTNQGLPGSDFLPDCRAYEMVSPPDKNGIDVTQRTDKTHVATDGNAVTFGALGSFGEVAGTAIDTEYIARRTAEPETNGWSTHGINPLARGVGGEAVFANTGTFVNAFSPDLDAAIYRSWRPLTGPSNTEDISNLYRIGDLREGPPQPEQILSDAVSPVAPPFPANPFGIRPGAFITFTRPELVGASADLGHVFFEEKLPLTADAQALLPPVDPNTPFGSPCMEFAAECKSQLYENFAGQVRLVDRIPSSGESECDDLAGTPCVATSSAKAAIPARASSGFNPYYSERVVSRPGDRIYFEAPAGPGGSPGAIYMREDGARTYQVAASAEVYDASRDGSRVFFISGEQLIPADQDGEPDVYMWDREAPPAQRLTLISTGSAGSNGYAEGVLGASEDGHTVYFVIDGSLIAGQAFVGIMGLYAWRDGELSYLGHFDSVAEVPSNTFRRADWSFEGTSTRLRITPDGRRMLFATTHDDGFVGRGGFAGYDQAGNQELYLYDAGTGRLRCATCDPSGEPAKGEAWLSVFHGAAGSDSTADSAHALTDDGRYVFFSSADALLPGDTNGAFDAYEYDTRGGALHLISSGTDHADSFFVDASDDGHDVFLVTREQLSQWDTDGAYDLYDARIGGGFPEPASRPAPCHSDSCLAAAPGAPSAAPDGTGVAGAGNPAGRCPKGRHRLRRHGTSRCVPKHRRKHQHRRHRSHRRAPGADRRASR